MKVVKEFDDKHRAFGKALLALRDKYAASAVYANSTFAGLKFKGQVPRGWNRRKDGLCVPNTRTKAGKAARAEVDALPAGFDAWSFSVALGKEFLNFTDKNVVHFSTYGRYGDKFVLCVPGACAVHPQGCVELKKSEFLKIVEDAAAAFQTGKAH
jgi:hypothetical protein